MAHGSLGHPDWILGIPMGTHPPTAGSQPKPLRSCASFLHSEAGCWKCRRKWSLSAENGRSEPQIASPRCSLLEQCRAGCAGGLRSHRSPRAKSRFGVCHGGGGALYARHAVVVFLYSSCSVFTVFSFFPGREFLRLFQRLETPLRDSVLGEYM
jgi:hypothetical protein